MPNNRSKGKRGERWFVNNGLREIFPDIKRNQAEQADDGGVDLVNTDPASIGIPKPSGM